MDGAFFLPLLYKAMGLGAVVTLVAGIVFAAMHQADAWITARPWREYAAVTIVVTVGPIGFLGLGAIIVSGVIVVQIVYF